MSYFLKIQFQPCFYFAEFKLKLGNFERDKLANVTTPRSKILTGHLDVRLTQCMLEWIHMTLPQTVAQ